ncbi:MAG TPA: CsbD family protein [Candidatus Limnocylindrales bacterium]|nr:CsbD family protein [Candidatus Limnocylindrales bacterium]
MTKEHAKGAISKARGKIEEAVGELTGDRRVQARGKVRQVQGEAQEGLGDVQDAVHKAGKETSR